MNNICYEKDLSKCAIWGTKVKTAKPILDKELPLTSEFNLDPTSLKMNRVRNAFLFDSPRAGGKYRISEEALVQLKDGNYREIDFPAKLTTWLVDQRDIGESIPLIREETLELIRVKKPLPIDEKINRFLRHCYDLSGGIPWKLFELYPTDMDFHKEETFYPLAIATQSVEKHIGEADYDAMIKKHHEYEQYGIKESFELYEFVKMVESQRLVEIDKDRKTSFLYMKLTAEGIRRLEEYLSAPNEKFHQAFVAMWFDGSMDSAYEKAIKPAIEEMGYEPVKINEKPHNNKIDDEIIADIKRSRFLIADFSQGSDGARGGVYYEAGFAHGLNIPVIFTCRKEDEEKLHFDTRQYNHIIWEDEENLKKQLIDRIGATIGDGPLKKGG